MIRIKIASPQEIVPFERAPLRELAKSVLAEEGVDDADISLALVDNPTIHGINKRFLDHDEPTDVITFPLSGPGAKTLTGELVIGVEVARDQAAERGHDVATELSLYVIHGLLHLCGYDDRTPNDVRTMRERERHHLRLAGLADVADE